ncbi:hypothetical protein O988_01013 [Pseudogymnoascus sp. VKM F-3808]|nr:hypothetical protein O988_01013 [Pseudogymnoascus sp. VKM F-3808]
MANSKVSKELKDLYRVPEIINSVPNEVWEGVLSYLPSLSSSALRRSLGFKATTEDDHHRIWNYFFKSDSWLNAACIAGVNPCLIGYDLNPLIYDKHSAFNVASEKNKKPKRLYLALIYGRDRSDAPVPSEFRSNELRELFYKSLQPWKTRTTHDIVFANGARLNVSDIDQSAHNVSVPCPRQLVSRKLDGLHSAYLYWKDTEYRVQDIKPQDVTGIGKGFTKKNVSRIVALNWKHLPSGKVRQQVFCIAGMDRQTIAIKNDGKITSFEWRPEWKVFTENGWKSNILASILKQRKAKRELQRKD